MKNKNIIASSLLLGSSLLLVGIAVITVGAANSDQVKVHTMKVSKTYQDVIAAPVPGGDVRFRDVDLGFSLPAGGEMLSTVVHVRQGFSPRAMYIVNLVGAGGSDFNVGNLGDVDIHNEDNEYSRFRVYSFSTSFPVHVTVQSEEDIATLSQGEVDFYFSWIEH